MATVDTVITNETFARALGWGATDQTGAQSRYLRQIDLRPVKPVDCTCPDFYKLETEVGPDGEDPCTGDSGGPLITEDVDGEFLLIGILQGGGIDCLKLGEEDYEVRDTTGDWMRVAAFRSWIEDRIFEETLPGGKYEKIFWMIRVTYFSGR